MNWIRRILLGLLAAVGLAYAAAAASVYRYSFEQAPGPADAAIVLGAAVYRDRPSPVFEERIAHAIDLYLSGAVRHIVFTGGVGRNDQISEAEAGRRRAIEAGVPASAISIDPASTLTCQNLLNARELAEQAGLSSFLLVSDPLHMKRAVTIASDLGMTAYPSPTPTTRYTSWRTKLPFLNREAQNLIGYAIAELFSVDGIGC